MATSPRIAGLSPVCALLLALAACTEQPIAPRPEPAPEPPKPPPYETRSGHRDGISKWYLGRQIAHVMGHQGAAWLERPEREKEEHPKKLVAALELKSGDVVADIGAGTGYFTFRLAPLVGPKGRILAVDIQPEMLDIIRERAKKAGAENVEPVLGTISDPKLPEQGVDLALFVDVYHEFSHPHEMMTAIRRSLKPGGRVVLVEYRGEDPTVPIKLLHKMTVAQVRKEMEYTGLKWVKNVGTLPRQHILIFER